MLEVVGRVDGMLLDRRLLGVERGEELLVHRDLLPLLRLAPVQLFRRLAGLAGSRTQIGGPGRRVRQQQRRLGLDDQIVFLTNLSDPRRQHPELLLLGGALRPQVGELTRPLGKLQLALPVLDLRRPLLQFTVARRRVGVPLRAQLFQSRLGLFQIVAGLLGEPLGQQRLETKLVLVDLRRRLRLVLGLLFQAESLPCRVDTRPQERDARLAGGLLPVERGQRALKRPALGLQEFGRLDVLGGESFLDDLQLR